MLLKRLKNKSTLGWIAYDWANSAFATTVLAGFFPLFFKNYWNIGVDSATSTARLGFATTCASLIIAFLSPVFGAISDRAKSKKRFLFVTTVVGAAFTAGLALIGKGNWLLAMQVYMIALMGFSACMTFYDALLVDVSEPENVDFISSMGYAAGYLGGGILLAINVLMFQKPELFGFADAAEGVKMSFLSVGIWWAVFSIPTFLFVKEKKASSAPQKKPWLVLIREGFSEVIVVAKKLKKMPNALWFILAYWIYMDGVQTIIKMAVDYGISLGFKPGDLIAGLLIVQFVGVPAGFLSGYMGQKWNLKGSIMIGLAGYFLVVLFAMRMQSSRDFYILAGVIGLAQGCVQALSRSLFSRVVPRESAGEYFGIYNLVSKATAVVGPSLMALGTIVTGSHRLGLSSLLILLGVGGTILWRKVKVESAG